MVDPIMQDVPWEIICDDSGKVLGEVYLLPLRQLNDGLIRKKVKRASAQ